MSIKAGLVGLPNVGKSTLFNALTKSSAPAENYPFCTIDPHVAMTFVPDERLALLQGMYNSKKQLPATVSFVDIAGLVKGAASGEGLGNQFLSHIREVDLILHVVRCFTDPNIIYSGHEIDPLQDYSIIVTELMLKDLESVQKRIDKATHLLKAAKQKPAEYKELSAELQTLQAIQQALNKSDAPLVQTIVKQNPLHSLDILTGKKYLIIANIDEHDTEEYGYEKNPYYQKLRTMFKQDQIIPISVKLEYELSQLSDQEAASMRSSLQLPTASGLDQIIQQTYRHLGLITFFTCGPQEIHAWPILHGTTIRRAAREIHSDLERGFICAEVFNYQDLAKMGSESKVREQGKLRTEGADYIVQDGDIVHIRFNV